MNLRSLRFPVSTEEYSDSLVKGCLANFSYSSRVKTSPASPWADIAKEEFDNTPLESFNTTSSGPILIRFASPAAVRLQLRACAANIWFPAELVLGLDRAFSYVAKSAPWCPSLAVGLDASSLIHLGQMDGDLRMLRAGQAMYGHALRLLRAELETATGKHHGALVGSISVLQITEAFTSMVFGATNWRLHTPGLTSLLLQARPDATSPPGFSDLLEMNFRTFHFWDALISKKRIDGYFDGHATFLYLVAETVPGVLADCDCLLRSKNQLTLTYARQLTAKFQEVLATLKSWVVNWNRCVRDAPYSLVSSTTIPFPEQELKKPSKAFPSVFNFDNLSDVMDLIICTACLFGIRRAILDVRQALASFLTPIGDEICGPVSRLTTSVTGCADSLCMALPHLCLPTNGQYGMVVATGPLFLASHWYKFLRRRGDKAVSEKVLWCFEASKRLKKGGIRPL